MSICCFSRPGPLGPSEVRGCFSHLAKLSSRIKLTKERFDMRKDFRLVRILSPLGLAGERTVGERCMNRKRTCAIRMPGETDLRNRCCNGRVI